MFTKVIILFLILFFATPLYGIDLNYELVASGYSAKRASSDSDIYGTVYAKLLNKDKIQSDLHLQIGEDRNLINVGYAKFMLGKFDIILGKQFMAWGSGYNFNPTDIFNSKPLGAAFDPVYTKTGRMAATVTSYLGDFITDVVAAYEYSNTTKIDDITSLTEKGENDFGLRIKKNLFDYDFQLSYTKLGERTFDAIIEPEDDIYGISIKGSLPKIDWGIWLEAARYRTQEKTELVFGLEYFYDKWTFNTEYYFNGFGESNSLNYDLLLLYRGRFLANNYIVPSVGYTVDEKLTLTTFIFSNLDDSSLVLGGVADYFYNDYIEIAIIPFFISGSDTSEYGMQKSTVGEYGLQGLIKITF